MTLVQLETGTNLQDQAHEDRLDLLMTKSRLHLERARVKIANARIRELEEELDWERSRHRRGLLSRLF